MMDRMTRSAVWLSALFVLPIALIRAQPYDGSALRALLSPPEGCPAPCFMGIRPGASAEDAITILENHPWVAEIEGIQAGIYRNALVRPNFTTPVVRWTWREQRPDWLQHGQGGELWLVNGRVRYVGVYTSLLLGDALLSLGDPDNSNLTGYVNVFGNFWSYDGWYGGQGVWMATGGLCPMRGLYTGKLLVRFQDAPPDFYGAGGQAVAC